MPFNSPCLFSEEIHFNQSTSYQATKTIITPTTCVNEMSKYVVLQNTKTKSAFIRVQKTRTNETTSLKQIKPLQPRLLRNTRRQISRISINPIRHTLMIHIQQTRHFPQPLPLQIKLQRLKPHLLIIPMLLRLRRIATTTQLTPPTLAPRRRPPILHLSLTPKTLRTLMNHHPPIVNDSSANVNLKQLRLEQMLTTDTSNDTA